MRSRPGRMRFVLPLVVASAVAVSAPATAVADPSHAQLVRRFTEEVYNQSRPDRIEAYVHPDFVDRSPGAPPDARGPAFVRKQYETTYAAFPDLRFTVEDVFEQGDEVVMRWASRGHFSGRLGDVQGQGQEITVNGISIFRIRDGKFIESWDLVDRLAMLRQMGFEVRPPANAGQGASAAPGNRKEGEAP